jgi:outer membrane lipoprotein-sorting protein
MDRINLSNQHVTTHLIDQEKNIIYSSEAKNLFVKPAEKVNYPSIPTPLESNEATRLVTEANKAAMEMAFLDPSFLLGSHELLQVEEATYDGHRVHIFRAHPRADREAAIDALFWSSADMYDLLVDAELGILLTYTAHLHNHPFAKVVVENFAINGDIPDEVREFTPLEGTQVHTPSTKD